jgi:hypothetical protein
MEQAMKKGLRAQDSDFVQFLARLPLFFIPTVENKREGKIRSYALNFPLGFWLLIAYFIWEPVWLLGLMIALALYFAGTKPEEGQKP